MPKYKKITLVDDDMDDRQLFREILAAMAPDVVLEFAENGLEMIAMLEKTPDDQLPEMIILDQNMPKMTGKESLIYIKDSPRLRHIPTVVYSTYQMSDFYRECLSLGAAEVLPKPNTMDNYRMLVEQLLK